MKLLSKNKKALIDFEIIDKLEAGIVLQGWEVKSLKNAQGNIVGSYIKERDGELFIFGMVIPAWRYARDVELQDENRPKKLLLQKRQIQNLITYLSQAGFSVVPLEVVEKNRLVKVILGVGKGRKKYDKRAKLKEKDIKRGVELDRKQYKF